MKHTAICAAMILMIAGAAHAFTSAGNTGAAADPLGVHLTVIPAWKDRVQYPTYPPPRHYRVVASVHQAGTRKRIVAPVLELTPGKVTATESSAADITAKMVARMNGDADSADVHVRVYSHDRLVHESRASVSLEKPPAVPASR